ncbi:MAG: hypothetical protein Q4G70_07010 [Pseudomonadota bacterium]|nr:hypothetical protein [Pseudomonadota bacterium]
MVTNTHTPDIQDTLSPAAWMRSKRGQTIGSISSDDLIALISPERLVVFIGLLAVVVLLLASIAGVARAQVRKGHDFRFAEQTAPVLADAVYTDEARVGVVALSN